MTETNNRIFYQLKLPRFFQLGFFVDNIEDSLPYYSSLYNIKKWFIPQFKSQKFFKDNKPISVEFKILLGYSGKMQIELIEVIKGTNNLDELFLNKNETGLHHISFSVNNIHNKLLYLNNYNIETFLKCKLEIKGGFYTELAYLNTKKDYGIIVELTESKLYGIPVKSTHLILNIGLMTGSIKMLSAK